MNRASLLVSVFIFLAGCVEASEPSAESVSPAVADPNLPQAEFSDTTGGITGRVLTDSLEPIADAFVAIEGTGHSTSSAADGGFRFDHIDPGTYQLIAEALGYESAALKIDVVAGAATQARLLLVAIPSEQPRHVTLIKKGFWECMVNVVIGSPPCTLSDDPRRGYTFDVGDKWASSRFEITWRYSNPGQATTPGAHFTSQGRPENATKSQCYGEFMGANPIRYDFRPGQWMQQNCNTVAANMTSSLPAGAFRHSGHVFPWGMLSGETQSVYSQYASGRSRGVGVSYNQPFDAYYSVFYIEPAPAGFSGMPDQ